MASTHETIAVLRELIESCREAADGYRSAAEHVDDGVLRSLFASHADERSRYLAELEQEVLRLGEDPGPMRTLPEILARGWAGAREALGASSRDAVVAACERGEDEAVATYRKALEAPLPEPIHAIVERQYRGVEQAHDRVRALERST
jgi:uncharacterized protein (TIGR02284 family)